ncbi:hypothetical protein AAG570_007715 [Ranatra chinensis]|uniref:Uncharacterized protein n=1 Tax=Ranatra chinensis TaxID=642074 RepID=A0ABD0XUD4_9HEMI
MKLAEKLQNVCGTRPIPYQLKSSICGFREEAHGICFMEPERDLVGRFDAQRGHHQCCCILGSIDVSGAGAEVQHRKSHSMDTSSVAVSEDTTASLGSNQGKTIQLVPPSRERY